MKRLLRILIYTALGLLALPAAVLVIMLIVATLPKSLIVVILLAICFLRWRTRDFTRKDWDRLLRRRPPVVTQPRTRPVVVTPRRTQPVKVIQRARSAHARTRQNTGRRHTGGRTGHFAHGPDDWHDDPAASAHAHFHHEHVEEDPHGHDRFFDKLRESERDRMEAAFWERQQTVLDPFEHPAGYGPGREPAEEVGKWIRGDYPYDHHRHDNDFRGQ